MIKEEDVINLFNKIGKEYSIIIDKNANTDDYSVKPNIFGVDLILSNDNPLDEQYLRKKMESIIENFIWMFQYEKDNILKLKIKKIKDNWYFLYFKDKTINIAN